ncbi:hypothetical protein SAMN04488072_101269 [Lentibacillus halodurans]|uniref:Peptidase M50 domain-containing protein n=1 Tax=Lentibacillus halodurans TaxID=237679 RepID=A0A1I0VA70_9BACI|nr:site-2 protease family protein [Lentibacillus halodurans]SFA72947.1 hypothetical protein SAMN04488072_101269 [Lentibacillus halodurans]
MDIYFFVYLIFFVAPVGTVIHELGHVLGAKLLGADKITLSVGTGSVMYHTTRKQIDISVHVLFFLGGVASSERSVPYRPFDKVQIAACGPLSSFTAAGLCYGLYIVYPSIYLLLPLLFNLWLALVNTIPFRLKGKQSDGYTICTLIGMLNRKHGNDDKG